MGITILLKIIKNKISLFLILTLLCTSIYIPNYYIVKADDLNNLWKYGKNTRVTNGFWYYSEKGKTGIQKLSKDEIAKYEDYGYKYPIIQATVSFLDLYNKGSGYFPNHKYFKEYRRKYLSVADFGWSSFNNVVLKVKDSEVNNNYPYADIKRILSKNLSGSEVWSDDDNPNYLKLHSKKILSSNRTQFYSKYYPLGPNINDSKLTVEGVNKSSIVSVFARKQTKDYETTFNNGIFHDVIGKDYTVLVKDTLRKKDFITQLFVATEGFTSWDTGAIASLLDPKSEDFKDYYSSNKDRVEVIYSNPDIFSKCMNDIQALQFGKWESGNNNFIDYDGTTVAKSMLLCIALSILNMDKQGNCAGIDKLQRWVAQSGNTDNASLLMTIVYGITDYKRGNSTSGSKIVPIFYPKSSGVKWSLNSGLEDDVTIDSKYFNLIGSDEYKKNKTKDKVRISKLQDVFSDDLFGWGNILHREYQSLNNNTQDKKNIQFQENIAYDVVLPYTFLESKYLSKYSSVSWLPNLFWNVENRSGYDSFNVKLDKSNKVTKVIAGTGKSGTDMGTDFRIKHLIQVQNAYFSRVEATKQNKYSRVSTQREFVDEYTKFLVYLHLLELSGEDNLIFCIRFRTNTERGDYKVTLNPEDAKWIVGGKTFIPTIPKEPEKAKWHDIVYKIPISSFSSGGTLSADTVMSGRWPKMIENDNFNSIVWKNSSKYNTAFTRAFMLPKRMANGFQKEIEGKTVFPDELQKNFNIELNYKLERTGTSKKKVRFNAAYQIKIFFPKESNKARIDRLESKLKGYVEEALTAEGSTLKGKARADFKQEEVKKILDSLKSQFEGKDTYDTTELNSKYADLICYNQYTAGAKVDGNFMSYDNGKSKLSSEELKSLVAFWNEMNRTPEKLLYKKKFDEAVKALSSSKLQEIAKLYYGPKKIMAPFGFLRPDPQGNNHRQIYPYSRAVYNIINHNKKPDEPDEEYNNIGYWEKHPSRSEIKEGSIGNETFEAMAGVPTTRNLYFSVGATEFRVRVKGTVKSRSVQRTYNISASANWSGTETKIPTACPPKAKGPCYTTQSHSGGYSGSVTIKVPTSSFNYFDLTDVELWRLADVGWEKDANFTYSTTKRVIGTGAYVFDIDGPADGNGRIIFSTRAESDYGSYSSSKDAGSGSFNGTAVTSAWSAKETELKKKCTKDITSRLKSAVSALQDVGATVVSDSITIHTSKGNQTLQFYSQKSDNEVNLSKYASKINDTNGGGNVTLNETTPPIRFASKTKNDYWKNNPNSCANWTNNDITFEGYNGQYSSPSSKYTNTNAAGKLTSNNLIGEEFTKLHFTPSGYKTLGVPNATTDNHVINGIDIIDTYENGAVSTGRAYTKYERVWFRLNNTLMNNTADESIFDHDSGFYEEDCVPYSDTNGKLNDIVIHDPVSTEYCTIVPNPSYFDQRVPEQKVEFDPNYQPFNGNNIDYKMIKESASKGNTFINLDREFKIFYPFRGDFAENPSLYGIDQITNTRGKGFTTPMDLREYTKKRTVKFTFDVIPKKENRIYKAGELIDLNTIDKNAETFEFYCILSNDEAAGTPVDWTSYAINNNGDYLDNSELNNAHRDNFAAKHSAWRQTYVDVVGTIGGLSIHDTEDWRFAQLFKQARLKDGWLVKNLVRRVDSNKQNMMVADELDVRREDRDKTGTQLNTYGNEPVKDKQTKMFTLPLVPKYNPIEELRNQTIRIGYNVFSDVETIGSYFGNTSDITGTQLVDSNLGNYLNIQPIYFAYDLVHNTYKPIDIYYNNNGSIVPAYLFNDRSSSSIVKYYYYQDFKKTKGRINVTKKELDRTKKVQGYLANGKWDYRDQDKRYLAGNAASIVLYDKHRTFVGSSMTNGKDMNPGDVNHEIDYQKHGQRWMFITGLPSSAQFVEAGKSYSKEEAKKITNKQHIIVLAGNIIAKGDVWTLRYTLKGDNSYQVVPGGKIYPKLPPPYNDIPIITVSRADKTSKDDIIEQGTH